MKKDRLTNNFKVRVCDHDAMRLRELSRLFGVKVSTLLRNSIETLLGRAYDDDGNVKPEIKERAIKARRKDIR